MNNKMFVDDFINKLENYALKNINSRSSFKRLMANGALGYANTIRKMWNGKLGTKLKENAKDEK